MTLSETIRIVVTVGLTQLLCDIVANWRVFNREPYQRAKALLSQAKAKLDKEKAVADKEGAAAPVAATAPSDSVSKKIVKGDKVAKRSKKTEDKFAKRLHRAEDDYADALANVANRHSVPSFMTSLVFLILLRILGAEYKGRVMGILPFVPFSLLQRVTARGLEFGDLKFESTLDKVTDVRQGFSFMVIYVLASMSIKHYVHSIFGTHPPPGAENFWSLFEGPAGKKMLKAAGFNPDDFKDLKVQ